jgi:4-hydroxybenzoate polyprenyltransferase
MHPFLRLLRPKQWIKNGFVFAPLFFAHQFLSINAWYLTIFAALCFICVSCIVYICNDISDVEEDRTHPVKCLRPLAAGEVTILQAALLACFFAGMALFILTALPIACTEISMAYLVANMAYTFYLKRIALIDICFIASCYVLRVLMGCYALSVIISPWIILTTFFLALFLGFSKRYHEMGYEEYARRKPNLQQYNRNLLDRLVAICGCATLITYAIYTTEMSHIQGNIGIVYTVGFVAFGLFRYLQAIYVFNEGGEPENLILKDKLQLVNGGLWLITTLYTLTA